MNTKELMKIVRDNRNRIRFVMLSDSRLKIVEWVSRNGSVDSSDLAKGKKCTIPNASTQLLKLYKMGWLIREVCVHESGGVNYRYRTTKF